VCLAVISRDSHLLWFAMSDREFFDIMLLVLLLGNEFGERLTHEEKGEPCIDVFRWKQTLSSTDDLFMFPGEGWSMGGSGNLNAIVTMK